MDTFTQAALGATIGEAGFRRRLGGKAPIVGGVCGLLPDLDVLMTAGDPFREMIVHRGSSHSLLVLPFAALMMGYLGYRWTQCRGGFAPWYNLAFWTLITHPLLDVFTTYGTQLLAPISRKRFALDGASIIDPVYSLPLLVACGLALRPKRERSQRCAVYALVATTAYLGLGYVSSQRVLARAEKQLGAAGVNVDVARALPTLFNNQVFRVVARGGDEALWIGHAHAWFSRPIDFVRLEPPEHPAVDALFETPRGRTLRWFSGPFLHVTVSEMGDRVVVDLSDQKFGLYADITASPFAYRAIYNRGGRLLSFGRRPRGDLAPSVGRELATLWRLLTTGQ